MSRVRDQFQVSLLSLQLFTHWNYCYLFIACWVMPELVDLVVSLATLYIHYPTDRVRVLDVLTLICAQTLSTSHMEHDPLSTLVSK